MSKDKGLFYFSTFGKIWAALTVTQAVNNSLKKKKKYRARVMRCTALDGAERCKNATVTGNATFENDHVDMCKKHLIRLLELSMSNDEEYKG